MKLPVANPARQVQSLGRRDINAPQRVANAQALAAKYEGAGLKALGKTASEIGVYLRKQIDADAVLEYNTAYAKAQQEVAQVSFSLEQPVLNVSENPVLGKISWENNEPFRTLDGSQATRPRTVVRTEEVAGQILDYQMDSIKTNALASMKDPRSKEKFIAEFGKLEGETFIDSSRRIRKQRLTTSAGKTLQTVDAYVRLGDYTKVDELITQAEFTGSIDPVEGAGIRTKALNEILNLSATDTFEQTETTDDVEAFIGTLMDSPMQSGDKVKWLSKAEARKTKLRTQYKDSTSRQADVIASEALDTMYAEGEGYTESDVQEDINSLRRMGQADKAISLRKTYETLAKAREQKSLKPTSEPGVLAMLQSNIADVPFPEYGTVVESRVMVQRQLRNALRDELITPGDYRTLQASLTQTSQLVYSREGYKATRRSIWNDVTGDSPDAIKQMMREARSRGASRDEMIRLQQMQGTAQRAENDYRAYIQIKGIQADENWWDKNRTKYLPESAIRESEAQFIRRFPVYRDSENVGRAIRKDDTIPRVERVRRYEQWLGINK